MAEAGDPDCVAAERATTAASELLTLIDVPPVGPQLKLAERCFREHDERLREIIADAYQIVGALADYGGVFDHPDVIRALDAFSDPDAAPDDLLPWPKTPLAAERNAGDDLIQGMENAVAAEHAKPIDHDELVAILMMADDAGVDPEYVLKNQRSIVAQVRAGAAHDGDCTKQAHTCFVCLVEHYDEAARAAAPYLAVERAKPAASDLDSAMRLLSKLEQVRGVFKIECEIIATALAEARREGAAERVKPTTGDVELMQRINLGRPVIDGPQGMFIRWDAVMEALAEARREGSDAAYAQYAKDHKDLVKVMYEERAAKVAEARREGEIAMRERAALKCEEIGAMTTVPLVFKGLAEAVRDLPDNT